MNSSELIHYKEAVSFVLEPDAPLCLHLENASVASEETVSRVDLHYAARSFTFDNIVKEIPLVLNHGYVLKFRHIVVIAVVVKELLFILIRYFIVLI